MNSQILSKDIIDIVLYHGHCADGFGSAFCVWFYYKKNFGKDVADKITYRACFHSADTDSNLKDDFITELTGKNIVMCDFSYKYDQLIRIQNVCKTLMILDHHKTAQKDLESISPELKIFDMARSAVGITWEFFFPTEKLPMFLAHIQDRDIWKWSLPGTNEFSTWLHTQKFDFELFETLLDEEVVAKSIHTGKLYLEYKDIIVQNMINRASYVIHEINNEYKIVLYANTGEFVSEVGNKLFNKYPWGDFSVAYSYDLYRNKTSFSLRSTPDRTDVSVIAKRWGGGGHRDASGLGLSGLHGSLSYDIIPDYEILTFLQHKNLGPQITSDSDIHKKISYVYTLYKISKLNKIIFGKKYLDLIKTKTSDSKYIVFETIIEGKIPTKKYIMVLNEKYIADPIDQLKIGALGQTDYLAQQACSFLEFSSEKEFYDIFTDSYFENMLVEPLGANNNWSMSDDTGSDSDI